MPKSFDTRSPSLTSQESYSAVIIADMVAEVPEPLNDVKKRKSSTKSRGSTKESNRPAANTEAGPPPMLETKDLFSSHYSKMNGAESGISKGVILNAVHFGQPNDINFKTDVEKAEQNGNTVKTLELSKGEKEETKEPGGFSEMSVLRKIAFGFSFLPSVLFILCFAVILPCKKLEPCVQEMWSMRLDGIELTSQLQVTEELLFTYTKHGENGIMNVDKIKGSEKWNASVDYMPVYTDCQKFDYNHDDISDCLVMDDRGTLYVFNGSNGEVLWKEIASEEGQNSSLPLILPDCNGDKDPRIATAVTKSHISIFRDGRITSSITTPDCHTEPSKLMAWSRNETTDIIFYCEKDGAGQIFQIPQNTWCSNGNAPLETPALLMKEAQSFRESLLLPTNDGLIAWIGDTVHLLQPDEISAISWEVSSHNHSQMSRILRYGKFDGKENQVALFSNEFQNSFQVTTLRMSDGNVTRSTRFSDSEIIDVQVIPGKEKDIALLLVNKEEKDLATEAAERINEVSTTIVNFIANDELYVKYISGNPKIHQDIALLDLSGLNELHTIKKKDWLNTGDPYYAMVAAHLDTEDGSLAIITAQMNKGQGQKSTLLRSTGVSNWDISVAKDDLGCTL